MILYFTWLKDSFLLQKQRGEEHIRHFPQKLIPNLILVVCCDTLLTRYFECTWFISQATTFLSWKAEMMNPLFQIFKTYINRIISLHDTCHFSFCGIIIIIGVMSYKSAIVTSEPVTIKTCKIKNQYIVYHVVSPLFLQWYVTGVSCCLWWVIWK